MQMLTFYDYYTNKIISRISGANQIYSKLNAEVGFSWELLLLTCRIKSSDAPGRPVTHMDSLTIDKADKRTSFTEKKSGFCVSARRTITHGSKVQAQQKRDLRETENEGWGERCSPVRDCSLFEFAWWMTDYLWKVLWKFTDGLWVQANWDSRLDPKLHLFLIPRVTKLTATDKIKWNSNNTVSLSQPVYPSLFILVSVLLFKMPLFWFFK